MLFGFGISVLLCHSKIYNVDDIGCFAVRSTNKEIIRLDIAVDEVLFVDCLDSGKLINVRGAEGEGGHFPTICFATITTVLMENLLLQ